MLSYPRVRTLDPVQIPPNGESHLPRFLLKDPACLSGEQLIVSLAALHLMEFADGSRGPKGISDALQQELGIKTDEADILSLLNVLDEYYLLDNERARQRLAEISPRPIKHGRAGYPEGSPEFDIFIDELLGLDAPVTQEPSRASILPHIDFFRGREAYRAGYQRLHGLRDISTVVILGISHAFCRTPFILTRKDFDTPFGVAQTDQELVSQLSTGLEFDPFLDEYNHLAEHSVEFHAVLLKRLAPQVRIVPILCRSFHQAIRNRHTPLNLPGVRGFLENLIGLRDQRPDIHFLASVDLAHMGLNFGGDRLTAEFLEDLKRRDLGSLDEVQRGNADAFFATHQADQGERNYCGTPAIYSLLHLFPQPFEVHSYRQCTDADFGSTVTIASATLRL